LALVAAETNWSVDHRIADALYRHGRHHDGEVRFWLDVSRVLHPDVLRIFAAVAAGVLAFRRRIGAAMFVVVALGGQAALEMITKLAVGRHRPSFVPPLAHAGGNSFPSGHSMTAFVAFGVVVVLAAPRLRRVAIASAVVAVVLVSYSRLALGVHFFSDVVGAWLLGAAWLVVADTLTYGLRDGRRVPDPPPER
jgi:undecaprenyl-diphosphatase